MIRRPKLWNRGLARASLVGFEPTMNPSPAAQSVMGMKVERATLYNQGQARKKLRKKTRTLNPVPAAITALGSFLKLPGIFKQPSEKKAAGVAPGLVAAALQGNLTAAKTIRDRSTFGIQAERNVWLAALAQLPAELRATVEKNWAAIPGVNHKDALTAAADALARPFALPGAATPAGVNPAILQAGAGVAGALGKQLIQSATRSSSSRSRSTGRVRQIVRYDPETGDKYKVPSNSVEASTWPSRKPTRAQLAGLGGGAAAAAPIAGKAAGLAGAGAGAIAGVVIGGLAVGLLIGTGLRKLFGTAKAVRAEEAAVQGALVLRNTRAQLEQQLGRKLNASESRALFDEYAAQLVQLGFVQNAQGMWHRPRSFTERLLG